MSPRDVNTERDRAETSDVRADASAANPKSRMRTEVHAPKRSLGARSERTSTSRRSPEFFPMLKEVAPAAW